MQNLFGRLTTRPAAAPGTTNYNREAMDKKSNHELAALAEYEIDRLRLRDKFAGQAMVGLLAGGAMKSKVADAAYALADSMMVAREVKREPQ